MAHLHPYPVDLSLAELVTALRDWKTNPTEAAHGAWHAIGYGLGKWDPHKLADGFAAASADPVLEAKVNEVLAELEGRGASLEDRGFSWTFIIPLLELLLKLLMR